MAFGTLFTKGDSNPRTTVLKVVAKANNLDLNVVDVNPEQLTAEHLKASPLGKIPAFVGEDGFALSEVVALAIYLTSQNEKTTLLGKTKQDYATILKWLSYANSEILPALIDWYRPLVGRVPYNKKAVDDASKVAIRTVAVLDTHLTHNTFLVGERITLADIFTASLLTLGFKFFFDKQWRQENPNATRWYDTVVNQPIYSSVASKLEYLEKPALTNVAPKKTEAAPAPAAAAPAAAAAAAAPAAEEEAPKAKHPVELLPKATYPLDDFKRYYSNNETPEALKYFWEKVPLEEEYSIWRVDYKYNDELTLTFMSNNLIGGFNTRLEGSRKYLFGSASVYGESNASVIQGAFVIRGQEFGPVFDVAPDYESYNFTKLDPKKAEDREFLGNQWSWEKPVTVDGKEYAHSAGKVFK